MIEARDDGLYGTKWHYDYLRRLFAEKGYAEGRSWLLKWDANGPKVQRLMDAPASVQIWLVKNASKTVADQIRLPYQKRR